MKLITLNIWGGHIRQPFIDFIKTQSDVDIFCFQEVYHNAPEKISSEERKVSLNIFSELQELLADHNSYFRPVVENVFGVGTFVRKNIEILGEGEITIHINENYSGRGPMHSRNLQWLNCRVNGKDLHIMNVHGLWNGMGKTDTPDRICQSQRIRAFMDSISTPKIVCGDFNLRPDTESLKILESDMVNHVKTNSVTSTRTSLYSKSEKFADYILTSPDIAVKRFNVLKDEVSDHAPLFLDFE